MDRARSNTEDVDFSGRPERERVRINYLAAVEITAPDGSVRRGNLRDIGLESLFVKIEGSSKVPHLPTPDTLVNVTITVNQGESYLTIGTRGRILRTDNDGVAIIFSEPLRWWPVFSVFPLNDQFLFDVVS